MKRIYGFLYQGGIIFTMAVLPRIRLTTGRHTGLGFQWFTAWLHIWLWENTAIDHAHKNSGRQWELLPHVWIHFARQFGAGMHIQWMRWHWHTWFWERNK